MLSIGDKDKTCFYEVFKNIHVEKFHLEVEVEEMEGLILSNDDSLLDYHKAFALFGEQPKLSSGFYFTNKELSEKYLEKLEIKINWSDCPDNFTEYYKGYPCCIIGKIDNDSFKVQLSKIEDGKYESIGSAETLFQEAQPPPTKVGGLDDRLKPINGQTPHADNKSHLEDGGFNCLEDYKKISKVAKQSLLCFTLRPTNKEQPTKYYQVINNEDPVAYPIYYKLELQGKDFLHQLYPTCLAMVALDNAEKIKGDGGNFIVLKPPFTPNVKKIQLKYTASEQWLPRKETVGILVHIYPFGWKMNTKIGSDGPFSNTYRLLPDFQAQGYLFIGIEQIVPSQWLSLLFKLGIKRQDNKVKWSYLEDNDWQAIEVYENMIRDDTQDLTSTGIFQIKSEDMESQNTLLPANKYWLEATIEDQCKFDGNCYLIETNAASATFVMPEVQTPRSSASLPPNTIKDLVKHDSKIDKVLQPIPSFLGRAAETVDQFYIRISERLRHKQRAINRWDYEHIILEQFPEIYKVKCLGHEENQKQNQLDRNTNPEVILVTVPYAEYSINSSSLQPEATMQLLHRIKTYLQQFISPFIKLHIKNPDYQIIKCELHIALKNAEQPYYVDEINQGVIRFLSPWAYGKQADIPFYSRIYVSSIIDCIEKFSFVDYVADIRFITNTAGEAKIVDNDKGFFIEVSKPDAILVSSPNHLIAF